MQTPPFARRVVSAVDRFLHVTARFLQDLAHLAGHVGRVFLLVANQNFAKLEQNLSTFGRGRASPTVKRLARRRNRIIDIFLSRVRKAADQIAGVGGVAVFMPLAVAGRRPLAVDVVVIDVRARARGRLV